MWTRGWNWNLMWQRHLKAKSILLKMRIQPCWRTLKLREWDHKLISWLVSQVISQVRLLFRKDATLRHFYTGFTLQTRRLRLRISSQVSVRSITQVRSHLGLSQQSSGQTQQLSLSHGEALSSLTDLSVQTTWHTNTPDVREEVWRWRHQFSILPVSLHTCQSPAAAVMETLGLLYFPAMLYWFVCEEVLNK